MRHLIFNLLNKSGFSKFLRAVNKNRARVPVLLFHRVHPQWDYFTEPVHPDLFEEIIVNLQRHYEIKPLKALFENNNNLENLRNSCFITFDDGTNDFKTFAYPIIKKYNVSTSMFLPTACIDRKETIWSYRLAELLANSKVASFEITINNEEKFFEIINDKSKSLIFYELHGKLLKSNSLEVRRVLNELENLLSPKGTKKFPLMTWSEIKEIHSGNLVTFYSHSANHYFLPNESSEIMDYELSVSKNTLQEKELGNQPYIAYPIGGYNDEVLRKARDYYKYGFAVDQKMVDLKKVSIQDYKHKIPRINIVNQNSSELMLRINGFHKLINQLRR